MDNPDFTVDGFTIDQHNGFGLALQKESGMLEVNLAKNILQLRQNGNQ